MLSVFQTDILLNEIIKRVIYSSFTGALWLLIALCILRLFFVKNPAVKHVFYALALSKGFVALAREHTNVLQNRGSIAVGIQFPSPFERWLPAKILPNPGESFIRGTASFATGPGLVVLAAAGIFLVWRFSAFVKFQRLIGAAPEIERRRHKTFFATLDRLIEQARVAYPKVILVNSNSAPFTVGFKRPIVALAPSLLEQLDNEEIEAVLAHEVAHIVRRDQFYHWPIMLMRDMLFFNPMTYFIYHRLSFERERACDDFSSKTSAPLTLAKSLVKIAELNRAEPAVGLFRAFAPQSFLSTQQQSHFSGRVKALLKATSYAPLSGPKRAFFWLGAFIFFWIEIHISVLLSGTRLFLS